MADKTIRLLKLVDVKTMTGLGRTSIYNKIAIGEFPKQIKLGERSVAWIESEVQQWIENTIAQSR